MNKVLSQFLDKLAERLAALAAGMRSSRLTSLHAADQAEQQCHLEHLARSYEQDNQPQVATALRQRASRLATTDLASEGLAMIQGLTHLPEQPVHPATSTSADELARLPDFTSSSTKTRNKRSANSAPQLHLNQPQLHTGVTPTQEPQA